MFGETILLIRDSRDAEAALTLANRVLEEWPADSRPAILEMAPTDNADEDSDAAEADVAWLYAAHSEFPLFDAMERVERWHIPTMLTRTDETLPAGDSMHEGVVVGPPDTEPSILRTILQSLASQSGLIYQLKQDLAVSHHYQSLRSTSSTKRCSWRRACRNCSSRRICPSRMGSTSACCFSRRGMPVVTSMKSSR